MTHNEIVKILALAAAFDQRAVGESDIDAWLVIANECGWTFPLARRSVIEHYKRDGERPRIRPAHITDRIDTAREAIRRHVFKTDLVPPRELADDPAAEIVWRRRYTADFVDRALAAWAAGEPLPQLDSAVVSTERTATTTAAQESS